MPKSARDHGTIVPPLLDFSIASGYGVDSTTEISKSGLCISLGVQKMDSDSIRIGVIGAGGNTRYRHIPGLQAIDGVEIISVCNRSMASGEKVAREFAIPQVCSHWSQVVEDPDLDAVVIGTWPYMHCPITVAALQAGKHVMVEARMAMNAAEAHDMLETSRAYPELVAQVVPSPFTLAFDKTICRLVQEQAIGDIYGVDIHGYQAGFADLDGPCSWRLDQDLSGLNIMGMGIWYEAMARWVGHANRVLARGKVCVRQRPKADGSGMAAIRVPDHLDIVADLDCGAQAHLRFSTVMGHAGQPWGAWLYGSKGTIWLDQKNSKLYLGQRDGELEEVSIPEADRGDWRVEAEFIGAIRGEEEIRLTSFMEGVKYMEFTEAVTRSMQSNKAVALPLLF